MSRQPEPVTTGANGKRLMDSVIDIYRAAWIVPVERPPVSDAAMAVEGQRIAWIGPARDAPGGRVHDLGSVVVTPGFINAHTHLELGWLKGRIGPRPLWAWFDELLRHARAVDMETVGAQAVRDGAAASLAAGVTCVADISRTGLNVAALADSPIRKVCFLELISGALQPPNNASSLAQVYERLADFVLHRHPAGADSGEPPVPHTGTDRLMLGLSPHAPYTVTQEDLAEAAALARRHRLPVTLHLLETPEEGAWLRGGPREGGALQQFLERRGLPTAKSTAAAGAIALLERTGVLACRPLLAHCNYLDAADTARLATAGASVAFCPRTHRFFGHAPNPWRALLAGGVNVCIGTDSLASNESLSVLDEIRFLRREARDSASGGSRRGGQAARGGVPAETLLAMGTIHAARALGLADDIGSLRPGKLADFVTMPFDGPAPSDPSAWIVDGPARPEGVWVGGSE